MLGLELGSFGKVSFWGYPCKCWWNRMNDLGNSLINNVSYAGGAMDKPSAYNRQYFKGNH